MDQKGWNKIVKFKIGERTESDHQKLEMRGKGKRRIVEEDSETVKIIEGWDEENIKRYREKEKEIRIEGKTTEDIWRNLKEGVEKCVIKKKVKIKRWKIGERMVGCGVQERKEKNEKSL